MTIDELATHPGEWLKGAGPDADIVMSSRIRLARNLASYPFIVRASDTDRAETEAALREAIRRLPPELGLSYFDVSQLDPLDRQVLVERQLVSRELADAEGARGVAIDAREQVSLMVNEEDHLRIQVIRSGLDLVGAWQEINRVDDFVEREVDYAFHHKFGYLTACPTNVGTGMRVSVMLHLPALVMTQQIDKVFRSLQKISLAVRGLYGEGSQAMGDFYQISNQITLGRSEEDLLKQVGEVIPVIISYEREARRALVRESHDNLHDRISRHYGILRSAQMLSSEETMHLLSSVRMGINLGLIENLSIPTVNQLFLNTQPAHLQKLNGSELDTADRNIERARYLRQHLELPRKDNGADSN